MNKVVFTFLFLVAQISVAKNLEGYVINQKNSSQVLKNDLMSFESDGCSFYPDGIKENPARQTCCIEHDVKYWIGGTEDQRKSADETLFECVKNSGEPVEAWVMYLGIRMGGGPYTGTTYRWGYGWTRIRNYGPLNVDEIKMAESLYGPELVDLRNSIKENKIIIKEPDDYNYTPELGYDFCEEQVLDYLYKNLKAPAVITRERIFEDAYSYNIQIKIDTCDKAFTFRFSQNTDSKSCKRDLIFRNVINRVQAVSVPKECR